MSAMSLPGRPNEPFLWGRGGSRLSADDIALQRRLAASQLAQGADFSPVQHWTQGAARAATGLLGGLGMRRADNMAQDRSAGQQESIAALLANYDPASGAPDPVAAALADPELRQLGMHVLESRTPKPEDVPDVITLARIANDPARPEWERQAAAARVQVMNDPQAVIPLPGGAGTYIGPQSGVAAAFGQGGGGQASGAAGATPPAVLPPDFDFGEGGPTQPASANFSAGFRGLPGETVTSTYRDPAHNRRVGGVSNSYHMRRDARGNPMARDSVPPPGMSMAAYADKLRRENPHLQVINEGDHVHMEPR